MKNVKDVKTGKVYRKDILDGSMEILHLLPDKYFKQTLSVDGKITTNIEKLKKGTEIQIPFIQI